MTIEKGTKAPDSKAVKEWIEMLGEPTSEDLARIEKVRERERKKQIDNLIHHSYLNL